LSSCLDVLLEKWLAEDSILDLGKCSGIMFPEEVMYIESDRHKVLYYTKDMKVHEEYRRLDEIEEQMEKGEFVRIHKSFLVNMKFVNRISNYKMYMYNGMNFSVSRSRFRVAKEKHEIYKERRKEK